MDALKIGDIVAHKSEPDICGYVAGITLEGYIIDFSISMPPNFAEIGDILVIKRMPETPQKATISENKNALRSNTDGFIKTLTKFN